MKRLPNKNQEFSAAEPTSAGQPLAQVRRNLIAEFTRSGVAEPAQSTDGLLKYVTGQSDVDLLARQDQTIEQNEIERIQEFARRRLRCEPISRIVGKRSFWNADFKLSPDTLDPRPDTEVVVEAAIQILRRTKNTQPTILDIGIGTGCILLSILSEHPTAQGIGIDISPGAIEVARQNAHDLGLEDRSRLTHIGWEGLVNAERLIGTPLSGVDLIVSNPPYIRSGDIASLPPEVRDYDPVVALDGSRDGLAAYRSIIAILADSHFSGMLVFEVGAGQADTVKNLLMTARAHISQDAKLPTMDLGGHTRAVIASFSSI